MSVKPQKIIKRGSISFAEAHPELIKEWNYNKNDKGPENYSCGSSQRIWWICEKGHEWIASPNDRRFGHGCPYCCGNKPIKGKTDLLSQNPEKCKEWDYERNEKGPDQYTKYSHSKVWWVCSEGHHWRTQIKLKTNCPYCAGKLPIVGKTDLFSIYPNLQEEWDYEKNEDINPESLLPYSSKSAWWKCKNGHSWKAKVSLRSEGRNCPYCMNKKVWKGYNDLETTHPDIAKEWDYSKNGALFPSDITAGNNKDIWWICSLGHSYKAKPWNRTRASHSSGCPVCAGKQILPGFNDAETKAPLLKTIWHKDKNENIHLNEIALYSPKAFWWQCSEGHEWKEPIRGRKYLFCPKCFENQKTSIPEKIVYYYIKQYFKDAIPNYSPEWMGKYEADIYIPSLKLAVEYDGIRWHGKPNRDNLKNQMFNNKGIKIIRIREKGCPILDTECEVINIEKQSTSDYSFMNEVVEKLFRMINIIYNLNIDMDIDVMRDADKIANIVKGKRSPNLLYLKYPNIYKEIFEIRDALIKPQTLTYGSHVQVIWKCSNCNYKWESTVKYRTRHVKCPVCHNPHPGYKTPVKIKVFTPIVANNIAA